MKGIVLAGGRGSRLYPLTQAVCKQLLPVYDKPLVYYPLSTLMLAGIREVLLITAPREQDAFRRLLGDGAQWGMRLDYAVQPEPAGIAQALLIGREFLAGGASALVLGDNLFHGPRLSTLLQQAAARTDGATLFACWVEDPRRYGVIGFDADGRAQPIEEKPEQPASHWAVTGLYFYDADAPALAAGLRPSARGELEITDLNNAYIESGRARVERLGRGYAWLDAGTFGSLLQAAQYVQVVQERQGLKIACLEEIAWRMGFIDDAALERHADAHREGAYGEYLRRLLYEK